MNSGMSNLRNTKNKGNGLENSRMPDFTYGVPDVNFGMPDLRVREQMQFLPS